MLNGSDMRGGEWAWPREMTHADTLEVRSGGSPSNSSWYNPGLREVRKHVRASYGPHTVLYLPNHKEGILLNLE